MGCGLQVLKNEGLAEMGFKYELSGHSNPSAPVSRRSRYDVYGETYQQE